MAEGADLSFIHLGISVQNMTKSFSIFGVSFAYYGLIIGIGMIAGLLVAQQDAKRRGQDPEIYLDLWSDLCDHRGPSLLCGVPVGIL